MLLTSSRPTVSGAFEGENFLDGSEVADDRAAMRLAGVRATAAAMAAKAAGQESGAQAGRARGYRVDRRRWARSPLDFTWRVLSEIHSSFTSSLMRGRMRMTSRPRVSTRIAEPSASMTSIDSVLLSSQGRAANA